MKVFISWSGNLSHKVACIFREWLPSVIQAVKPYVSSEDIDKGTRWSTDIAGELEESSYGIICVTKENITAPWISFEAGALSKSIDKANVSPFLFDARRAEIQGPLVQFQSTIYEEADVLKLLKSINKNVEDGGKLTDLQLEKSFSIWWPHLKASLDNLKSEQPAISQTSPKIDTSKVLEEILELVRNQQRLLSNPTELLPTSYLEYALSRAGINGRIASDQARILERLFEYAERIKSALEDPEIAKDPSAILPLATEVKEGLQHVLRRYRLPSLARPRKTDFPDPSGKETYFTP